MYAVMTSVDGVEVAAEVFLTLNGARATARLWINETVNQDGWHLELTGQEEWRLTNPRDATDAVTLSVRAYAEQPASLDTP